MITCVETNPDNKTKTKTKTKTGHDTRGKFRSSRAPYTFIQELITS